MLAADQFRLLPALLLGFGGDRRRQAMQVCGRGHGLGRGGHVILLGEQGAGQTGQHVARAGGAQPGRCATRRIDVVLIHHDGHRALQQYGGAGELVGTLRAGQRVQPHVVGGVRLVRIGMLRGAGGGFEPVEQFRHLAGMWRDHHLAGHTLRQQVECAGIHHDWRHVVGVLVLILAAERVMLEQCGDGVPLHIAVGALDASLGHAGPHDPGLHMSLADHGFRQCGEHHVLRALRAQIPDHAGVRAGGGAGGEHGGTGVALRAGHQTNHAPGVFGILEPGETDRVGRERIIHHLDVRILVVDIESEIEQLDTAAGERGGRQHRARLHRAERDRDRGRNVRAGQRTIVHTDAGWRIHSKYQRKIA